MGYDIRKYYPNPTFVHINEEGEISLNWHRNHASVLIVLDNSKKLGELDSASYGIYTGSFPDGSIGQDLVLIESADDVKALLDRLGLEPKE